ncbi:unnamed protein product [Effrenium voratum]|nr:unnamed protein product [Effrenium voratum]
MFCDLKCGNCIGEDPVKSTIKIDLAQLRERGGGVPAEAVPPVPPSGAPAPRPLRPLRLPPECEASAAKDDAKDEAKGETRDAEVHGRKRGLPTPTVLQQQLQQLQQEREELQTKLQQLPKTKIELSAFLEREGFAGVNEPKRVGFFGSTYPLHKAAEMADEDLVRVLLAEGADPGLTNSAGRTAAEVAKKKDHCGSHAMVFNLIVDASKRKPPKAGA